MTEERTGRGVDRFNDPLRICNQDAVRGIVYEAAQAGFLFFQFFQ